MTKILAKLLGRLGVGTSVAAAAILATAPVWSQVPDAAAPATDAAKSATKGATDTAKDTTKAATDTAKDATKDAADTGKSATKSATDTAKSATKSATDTARDTTKSATETARDTTKSARDTARDTTRDARDTVKGARDNATDTVRDAARDTRDTVKGAREGVRDTREGARDTVRDAREGARDAREGVRDTREGARDTVRDATRDTRDTVKGAREEVRDTRDDARDTVRDTARDARDTVRDARGDVREGVRDTVREGVRDVREGVRDTVRDVRGSARFNVSTFRSADMGLWFNTSGNALVISDVATSGPIARLGFREGDRIVSVNGQRVVRERDFITYLFADDVRNDRVKVIVLRDGREEIIFVEPTVFIEQYTTVQHDPMEQFGVILDDRYDDQLIVWKVIPRSPAFYAGIRAGDVLVTWEGQRLNAPADFVRYINKVDPGMVTVGVNRNRAVRQLQVDVPDFRAGGEARTTFRQDLDNDTPVIDRRQDRLEGREERREDRRDGAAVEGRGEIRADGPGGIRAGANVDADVNVPRATTPAVAPPPVRRPAAAPPARRPGLLPRRNR